MGQDTSKNNYRPVSNLNFLSKLVERCVLDQYTNHLDLNSLNLKQQSAYKAGHSCESALLKICNDIFWSMEKKDINVLIMLDLSAAFDTVSHKVLINLLEKQFGVSGTALMWFQNYLHNRKVKACVDGQYSMEKIINFSVPQGSLLGHVLFNTYCSTLVEMILTGISINGFADDHLLQKSCKPGMKSEIETVELMQTSMVKVDSWMKENRLKLNPNKTEFINLLSLDMEPH